MKLVVLFATQNRAVPDGRLTNGAVQIVDLRVRIRIRIDRGRAVRAGKFIL